MQHSRCISIILENKLCHVWAPVYREKQLGGSEDVKVKFNVMAISSTNINKHKHTFIREGYNYGYECYCYIGLSYCYCCNILSVNNQILNSPHE